MKGLVVVVVKNNKNKQVDHFNLPEEDRLELNLKDKEKAEKDSAIEEVFKKLDKKYKKKP